MDQNIQFSNGWTDDKNEQFLSYIRSRWLVAPSYGLLNISTKGKQDFSQLGQSAFVDKVKVFLQIYFILDEGILPQIISAASEALFVTIELYDNNA